MKTPVEQAIEALESSIGAHKIAVADADVKGLTRTWSEEALKSCSAALASLKSMQPRLTVPQVMSIVGPLCIGDATAATILERLTQKAKP